MFRKIIVGMSGGVDSAVAAHLLKEKGFEVLGIFMKNWDEFDEIGICNGEKDLLDAEYACKKLNIELKQVNYVKDYWNLVFSQFLEDYQNGLTPNPDILCNRFIKFNLFFEYALSTLKYDAISTGHYAKTNYGPYLENYRQSEDIHLLIPRDKLKDQTFFLSGVNRDTLKKTMFPLGNYLKSEVKSIAYKCGLGKLSKKKESTGLCFIGNRDFKDFIRQYIPSKPGNFIDIDNSKIVGCHEGIHQWTIGQRCRLANYSKPFFVASKDVQNNTIYVAAGHDNPALFSNKVVATSLNWLSSNLIVCEIPLRCTFRFQHTKPLVPCSVHLDLKNPSNVTILLDTPLRAITPGQYAVFYSDTECLGSARIKYSFLECQNKLLCHNA